METHQTENDALSNAEATIPAKNASEEQDDELREADFDDDPYDSEEDDASEQEELEADFDDDPYINSDEDEDEKLLNGCPRDSPSNLQYASKELKNDRESMLAAVATSWDCFEDASEELINDREFVLAALLQKDGTWNDATGRQLKFVSQTLKNDAEVVMAAINKNASCFSYASEQLKNDREFVLSAVSWNPCCLLYVPEELKNDRDIALEALKKEPQYSWYISEQLKNDREFTRAAVKTNPDCIKYASEQWKNDIEIVVAALEGTDSGIYPLLLKDYMGKTLKETIKSFQEMFNLCNLCEGAKELRALDRNDKFSLSLHVQEKLGLHQIFGEFDALGMWVVCETGSRILPPGVVENIAAYAGVPADSSTTRRTCGKRGSSDVVASNELEKLRLAEEVLPIASVCAKKTNRTWAVLVDSDEIKWSDENAALYQIASIGLDCSRVGAAPVSNSRVQKTKEIESPAFSFGSLPSTSGIANTCEEDKAKETATSTFGSPPSSSNDVGTVTFGKDVDLKEASDVAPPNPFASAAKPGTCALPASFTFGIAPPSPAGAGDKQAASSVSPFQPSTPGGFRIGSGTTQRRKNRRQIAR